MDFNLFDMASDGAEQLVSAVIDVYKQERADQSLSIRAVASKANLDPTMLSRVEKEERIPSFSFFVDWGDALNLPIEKAISIARKRINR